MERLNGLEATRASLLQGAVSSLFDKEAAEKFRSVLQMMTEGV